MRRSPSSARSGGQPASPFPGLEGEAPRRRSGPPCTGSRSSPLHGRTTIPGGFRPHSILAALLLLVLAGSGSGIVAAAEAAEDIAHPTSPGKRQAGRSLTDNALAWPSADQVWRTLTLSDHNTRVVFAGVTALGAAGGMVGTFLLLRKRSLLSDTVSHCTLPGIALAFLAAEAAGLQGRSLPILLGGAATTGVMGMVAVSLLRRRTRVRDDAALAIILSVFFGLGIALLVVIQQLPTGNAAGLSHFIYGKAAAMTSADARTILVASAVLLVVCVLFFKEFKLLCFDQDYARTQGWPALALDLGLMGLVVAVTVIGLQAAGILLVVAMLIIPSAAARFWSDRLGVTMAVAAGVGAISGLVGVAASALFPKLPAGAVIVLAAAACFSASFVFGARRGLAIRWLERRRMEVRVARQHLLRAIYEWCEAHRQANTPERADLLEQRIPCEPFRDMNSWSPARFRRLLRLGAAEGLLSQPADDDTVQLSARGKLEARRVTRNHRLWETYLLQHADVAPQHIHHNADQIEHVIDPQIVNELEELLAGANRESLVPPDPEKPAGKGALL